MATMCTENCTDGGILYELVSEEIWAPWNAALNYFEYQPWLFSLFGSIMVGLSGIFPLAFFKVKGSVQGVDLKYGEGFGTLNILLSFAVGGLLGDVFLHLLPEAWANKALNQGSEEGHVSMTCGLWVLAGFLVFIIAEKMFSGIVQNEDDEDDDDDKDKDHEEELEIDDEQRRSLPNNQRSEINQSPKINTAELLNNNFQKELENNNCLMPNGNVKNGCVRNAHVTNGIPKDRSQLNGSCCEMSNGCSNGFNAKLSNGFLSNHSNYSNSIVKPLLNGGIKCTNGYVKTTNEPTRLTKDSTLQTAKKSEKKEKAKHISGYLNLLANSIDNFTHGLAVGGAFLVSFRVGALTTLAILVHEIPHEFGDYAILLKSGFNEWDAAKAQLLTAGGGIFGSLIAVLCSGGGVEARTSWILPFTAGGFLHIGLVTVLPELLQETNPKESLKQLAALLLGITLMAFMTAIE